LELVDIEAVVNLIDAGATKIDIEVELKEMSNPKVLFSNYKI
jgi:DNA mismatch repair ATPase MutL